MDRPHVNVSSDRDTLKWVTGLLSAVFFLQVLMSWRLWLQVRDFPLVPSMGFVPVIRLEWVSQGLLAAMILFLAFANINKYRRVGSSICLMVLGVFILLDLTRLQAWVFMYVLFFLSIVLPGKYEARKSVSLDLMRFIILGTYFWSGLHKLNIHFIEGSFPWMLSGVEWLSFLDYPVVAWCVPFIEIGIAFLLGYNRTRKLGVIAVLLFHLGILFLLGPLGHNWNTIVWPWNGFMILVTFLLFRGEGPNRFSIDYKRLLSLRNSLIIILLAGILPVLHFTERWDSNLSFSMYTGLSDEVVFYVDDMTDDCFGEQYDPLYFGNSNDIKYLSADDLGMEEMNVPAYASGYYFKRMGKEWCSCIPNPENKGIEVLKIKNRWSSETKFEKLSCESLLKLESPEYKEE